MSKEYDSDVNEAKFKEEVEQVEKLSAQMREEIRQLRELGHILSSSRGSVAPLSTNPLTEDLSNMKRTSIRLSEEQVRFSERAYESVDAQSKEHFYGLCVAFAQKHVVLFSDFVESLKADDPEIESMRQELNASANEDESAQDANDDAQNENGLRTNADAPEQRASVSDNEPFDDDEWEQFKDE